jgi:hypothetical protein
MVKTLIEFKRKQVIVPENSFISEIVIDKNIAEVTMHDRSTIYTYPISDNVKSDLISAGKNGLSIGKIFNQYMRGRLLSKTTFE